MEPNTVLYVLVCAHTSRERWEKGKEQRRQDETDGKGKWQRKQGHQKLGRDRRRKGETDGDKENMWRRRKRQTKEKVTEKDRDEKPGRDRRRKGETDGDKENMWRRRKRQE